MPGSDGGSAFPVLGYLNEFNEQEKFGVYNPGMTLRDYFAAVVIQGMYASTTDDGYRPDEAPGRYAKHAYEVADAMLVVRGE